MYIPKSQHLQLILQREAAEQRWRSRRWADNGFLFGLNDREKFLWKNGTEEIIEAEDMDKYSNDMVSKGASKICQLAVRHGMTCRRLVWNPNYKGIDDWQLALHRKSEVRKENVTINAEQQTQLFRVYQLDLDGTKPTPLRSAASRQCTRPVISSRRRQITGWSMMGQSPAQRTQTPRMYWISFTFVATIPSPRAIRGTVCPCPMWWSCMIRRTEAISTMTRQALPPYSFPQGWQNPARKGITAYRGKEEQLKEMSLFCQALGAEVQYHPLHRYFTAMFWDGWDLAYNEGPAPAEPETPAWDETAVTAPPFSRRSRTSRWSQRPPPLP